MERYQGRRIEAAALWPLLLPGMMSDIFLFGIWAASSQGEKWTHITAMMAATELLRPDD